MAKHTKLGRDDDSNEVSTQSIPAVIDTPYVSQSGPQLNCTMGNWEGEPTGYSYAWSLDGTATGADSPNLLITPGDVGKTASCELTATNAEGSVYVTSNSIVIEDQGFDAPPVNLDEPKTYEVLEDNTRIEVDGEEKIFMKGDQAQVSINQAREAIGQGARIVGID